MFAIFNKMVSKLVLLVTVSAVLINNVKVRSASTKEGSTKAPNPNWWKHSVIYQIYPRSFKDSNNDGIGDLKGITEKLGHLKDAGITAAWLSPIYKSPQVDQGYDISDYKAIDENYGTMADFEELLKEAHNLGIKIVMDFVPNHSSDQHEWFKLSQAGNAQYNDFYIWRKGNQNTPPNNWLNNFDGRAWTYDQTRKEWYLHQFAPQQPDLNYRSDAVKAAMKEIIEFWLEKGVDGFRMDAVPYLVEHESFPDEPPSGNTNVGPEDYRSLDHIYTTDQDGTYEVIYDWRAFIDEYNQKHPNDDPRIMMTEAYTTLEKTMKYYTNGQRAGAHFTFNFMFITDLNGNSTAPDIVRVVTQWIAHMPDGCVANWVLGNHDNHRVASRYGTERVDGLNMLMAFLPGIMVTYNGEEIGQENGEVTKADCKDPRACKVNTEEEYQAITRDVERTPFHWDDSTNAGFNTGATPWLPVSQKHLENNLAAQNNSDARSHYQIYKQLVKLRQEAIFANGKFDIKAISFDLLGSVRAVEGSDTYILLFNIGNTAQILNSTVILESVTPYLQVVLSSSDSPRLSGEVIASDNIDLAAYECLIVKTTSESLTTEAPGNASGISISFLVLCFTLFCTMLFS